MPRPDPNPCPTPGPSRQRPTPNERAQAALAAVRSKYGHARFTVTTPAGPVTIDRVEVVHDPSTGVDVVEVLAPGFADPHFRVVNPPRFVPDPAGAIILNGHPFRDDPVAALAHVIAQHGGGRKDPRRGRP
jgi:hypothetical protein